MGSLSKSLCQRSSTAILPIETLTGILYRDVLQRSYQEMLFRPCTEIVGRDLPQRSWRREPGSLAQAVEDILTKGSCTASSAEILPRRSCARSFTGIFTKRTCRIYPGISSSCSLQHCLVPIAGTFFSCFMASLFGAFSKALQTKWTQWPFQSQNRFPPAAPGVLLCWVDGRVGANCKCHDPIAVALLDDLIAIIKNCMRTQPAAPVSFSSWAHPCPAGVGRVVASFSTAICLTLVFT